MDPLVTEQHLRDHARALCRDIGERTVELGGLRRAEHWIHQTLAGFGLEPSRQTYVWQGIEVANLVRDVGPEDGGPPLIIGAHYDTVPGTEGADDNGSAVCVLVELARRLAERPPSLSVRLVAFTLEEPPAFFTPWQGSRVYVRQLKHAGESIRGAVVLEMVGYTAPVQQFPAPLKRAGYRQTGDFIGVVGNGRSRRLTKRVAAGLQRNPQLPVETLNVPLNGWLLPPVRASDHSSFWDRGLPAVMVTDTAWFRNPHYHTPLDRIETLDYRFMAQLVDGLERMVEQFGEDTRAR